MHNCTSIVLLMLLWLLAVTVVPCRTSAVSLRQTPLTSSLTAYQVSSTQCNNSDC